jgi:hypothetical protein
VSAGDTAQDFPPRRWSIGRGLSLFFNATNRLGANLGHRDTLMVEHHYRHLAKSFVADAIRAHAPVYGPVTHELSAVVPLHSHPGRN